MPQYRTLYVAQYDNGGSARSRLPYHWRLVAESGRASDGEPVGDAFYVFGSPAMGYKFCISPNSRFRSTSNYRGCISVATVSDGELPMIKHLLQYAAIRAEPGWTDQTWVYGAIRRLAAQRVPGVSYWPWDKLVEGLKRAEDAWESMEDY